jgi:hypothetical protein
MTIIYKTELQEMTAIYKPGHHEIVIHEHRAPTDEAIKIFKELEEKAKEKVMNGIRLENLPMDAIAYKSNDFMNNQLLFMIVYKINGKQRRVEYRHNDFRNGLEEDICAGLQKAMIEDLASVILSAAFKNLKVV